MHPALHVCCQIHLTFRTSFPLLSFLVPWVTRREGVKGIRQPEVSSFALFLPGGGGETSQESVSPPTLTLMLPPPPPSFKFTPSFLPSFLPSPFLLLPPQPLRPSLFDFESPPPLPPIQNDDPESERPTDRQITLPNFSTSPTSRESSLTQGAKERKGERERDKNLPIRAPCFFGETG